MAYLCKDCHDRAEEEAREKGIPYPHTWSEHIFAGTRLGILCGPCESCGAVGETVDCDIY
jgi:hypothetical protein